ncbi:hypothetical protein, partial [Caballeronia glathei]
SLVKMVNAGFRAHLCCQQPRDARRCPSSCATSAPLLNPDENDGATMDALIELSRHTWAVILLVAVPIGALVGFWVNIGTLRKAAQEREKLDLEIAKLKVDAADRE